MLGAVDARGRALGLRPGQTAALAQASVPGLALVEAEPEADAAALAALAGWCLRYSPVVQADPPDGVFIDVEGATHLFGGEAGTLRDLVGRLGRRGLAARAALADTPGAARALARFGGAGIAPPGRSAEVLAPLPVAALRLPAETIRGLTLLGIERVGQLADYSSAQLTRRFGPGLMAERDRAFGFLPEPLTPLLPKSAPLVRLAFPEPLGALEGLEAALGRLAPLLCRELEAREAGLRRLDAVFRRVDGRPLALRVGTAAPSRDPRHLAKLLAEKLPAIDPGFGIDEIRLVASRTEPLRVRQAEAATAPDGEALDPAALAPLVDRLTVLLGASRVFRLAPVESRVPERSVRRVPALAPATGASWPAALPRPSRIIDPPEEVRATALLPDYPPSLFVWRRVRHVVRAADGPERVHGEWWLSDAEAGELRDYYRVEDETGRRFWLFRNAVTQGGARWWMHGRFG